jgi:hypothetical protein
MNSTPANSNLNWVRFAKAAPRVLAKPKAGTAPFLVDDRLVRLRDLIGA